MTAAAEAVALTFDRAYRNAGGRGDARSFLRTGRGIGASRAEATFRRLHADEGRGEFELCSGSTRTHNGRRLPSRTETLLIALAASSLVRAERRREAIATSGEDGDPEWSMTAHPLVAAAMRLYAIPAEPARLGDDATGARNGAQVDAIRGYEHEGAHANLRTLAGHVWVPFLKEVRTGLRIDETRGRMMARLTIQDMIVPHTVAVAMRGRPLSELIDHPVIDLVPDLRICRIRNNVGTMRPNGMGRPPSVIVETRARPVPLAVAPDGVDVGWRRLPTLHYADVE